MWILKDGNNMKGIFGNLFILISWNFFIFSGKVGDLFNKVIFWNIEKRKRFVIDLYIIRYCYLILWERINSNCIRGSCLKL